MTHPANNTTRWLKKLAVALAGALPLVCGTPRAPAINIIYESLGNTTHPQILDGTFTFDAENPAFDPAAAGLLNILQEVENVYQDAFEDAATIRITYWWDADMTFCCGQSIPALMFENPTGTLTHAIVRFNPTTNYYIDPTPSNDSEYNMQQTLYNFAGPNALTPTQQTARFSGNVPDQFEAGYNGNVVPGGNADGQGNDLLTLAFQEVGHSLGMNAGFSGVTNGGGTGEVDDGDYDVNTNWVNGNVMQMLPRGGAQDPLDHLAGNDTVMGSLSIGSERTRPSAADYFAIAAAQGWTNIDLPRQDFLGGGDWNTGFNWMGGQVPLSLDAAFVRHGGAVTLSGNGNVDSLLVDNDSSVQTGGFTLFADDVIIQKTAGAGTPRILVQTVGDLVSDNITVDNGARLDVFGGAVQTGQLNILAGGELRGNGTVDLPGLFDELVNDGTIRASGVGTLLVTSGNNLALDLDGEGENGEVIATVADIDFQAGLSETFNGDMTIGAGRFINFGSSFGVGSGGLVLMQGTSVDPAQLTGSLFFLQPGGVLRADGRGDVLNSIFLAGIAETQDAGSELRLNGTTTLDGGGIFGPGTARQNGNVFVTDDTTIQINTYDMDGVSGNTIITIEPNNTLDVNSPNIDTAAANDFDGTINVNSGTLDVAPNWLLDGTINLNQTAGTVPELTGAGILTIRSGGQLNVSGSGNINQQVIVSGGVFAGSEANFNQITSFTSTATVETDGPGDAIDLNGITTMAGGSYVGNGAIKFDNQVFVTQNTSIGMADTDLDGDSGNAQINIQPNVTFSVSSINLDLTPNDGFDGVMNNEGTFSSIVTFRLDGTLNMDEFGGAGLPTLAGLGAFIIHTPGEMNTTGDTRVNRNTTVRGTINIGAGTTQINGTATFEPTAVVNVAPGGELELNGFNTFDAGSYTGAGLIQFNADTTVNSNTTIATARVDLDGAAEITHVMVNDSALVLNVDGIDLSNNFFAGVIDVTGASARLEVNLSNPVFAWQLSTAGILNFTTPSALPVTMLDGSDLSVNGRINADGRVRFGANVGLVGRLQLLTSATDAHFGGGGQNLIFNTAIVDGPGQVTIDDGTRMHLENGTNVGVDVENAGLLGIGFQISEVDTDLVEPGAATIRGNFAQTTTGIFDVELGGLVPGNEYDVLSILGVARLNGALDISLIDSFNPMAGDMFTILTATAVIGTYDQVMFPVIPGIGLCVVYTPNSVILSAGLQGDLNGDGFVGIEDLNIVLGLWNQDVDAGVWLQGDASGDGFVGIEDLNAVLGNWNAGTPPGDTANIPEPASFLLTLLAFASLVLSQRRTARWKKASIR